MATKDKFYTIGVDIGGTKMSAVLFDGAHVLADYTLATPKDDLASFLNILVALIEPLKEKAKVNKGKIKGIGFGVPGEIDFKDERIVYIPNLKYLQGQKIADLLKQKLGEDNVVRVDNDAKCFVRAEAKLGAGRKYQSVFGVTIGTGIGSGWWINGQMFKGSHGTAMELSPMVIDVSSKVGLEESFHRLTQNNPAIVAEEAYRGDELAEKLFIEIGEYLGIALSNVVNLIDPEIVVVGGGVIPSSDLFLPTTKKVMKAHLVGNAAKEVKVVKSGLGKLAGAIGAALLIE